MPDTGVPQPKTGNATAPASSSAQTGPVIDMTAAPAAPAGLGRRAKRQDRDVAEAYGPTVIALGSPKGGTGKSTTAMLLTVALMKSGHKVGSIDLDGQQGTMSQYLTNRGALIGETGEALDMPKHYCIRSSPRTNRYLGEQEEKLRLQDALRGLADRAYVVIDTPGSDCHLARLACKKADTVVTPLNDSLLDIEVLARIDPRKRVVLGPSDYSRMIWQENDHRAACGQRPLDWVVMRNRLGYVESHNAREVGRLLGQLAQRLGFRVADGLSERVVFRELFLNGLTLLDPCSDTGRPRIGRGWDLARREVDNLLQAIGTPVPAAALQEASR